MSGLFPFLSALSSVFCLFGSVLGYFYIGYNVYCFFVMADRDLVEEEIGRRVDGIRSRRGVVGVKTPEELILEAQMYGDRPKDQFHHQDKLLFHVQHPPKTQMDLLPPDALLGNIKDSKTLFLLQKDNEILNRFYDMGLRCDGVMDLFESVFFSWWQQMRLTGALGGTERWLQSFLEPGAVPYEHFTYLEKRKKEREEKKRQSLLGMVSSRIGSGSKGTYE